MAKSKAETLEQQAARLIERFVAAIKKCRAEDGDNYGKPNFIDDDGTERFVPCEQCAEHVAVIKVIRQLLRRLQSTEQERTALQSAAKEWQRAAIDASNRAKAAEQEA